MLRKRVNLLGINIDDISLDRATFLAYKSLRGGKRRSFFTPNLEMLSSAQKNEEIKKMLNSASVSLPDGFSLKIIAKILGKEIKHTVAGIEFGEALVEIAEKEGARVFLLGGRKGVAPRAAKSILAKHPSLRVCGTFHGYFKAKHIPAVARMIEKSGADILIVCQGFPKQEHFANFVMKNTEFVKVVACLGGAFDIWSGDLERAPKSMRDIHAEWLWRIIQEPSRLERFVKSLDAFPCALEKGIEKMILCGMKR